VWRGVVASAINLTCNGNLDYAGRCSRSLLTCLLALDSNFAAKGSISSANVVAVWHNKNLCVCDVRWFQVCITLISLANPKGENVISLLLVFVVAC